MPERPRARGQRGRSVAPHGHNTPIRISDHLVRCARQLLGSKGRKPARSARGYLRPPRCRERPVTPTRRHPIELTSVAPESFVARHRFRTNYMQQRASTEFRPGSSPHGCANGCHRSVDWCRLMRFSRRVRKGTSRAVPAMLLARARRRSRIAACPHCREFVGTEQVGKRYGGTPVRLLREGCALFSPIRDAYGCRECGPDSPMNIQCRVLKLQ